MTLHFKQCNRFSLALAGLITLAIPQTVLGQEKSDSTAQFENRFQIEKQADGFVRLDKKTGETSFCRQISDNLVCKLAIEERDAFHQEIADLQGKLDKSHKNQQVRPDKNVPDTSHDEFAGMDKDKFERELDDAMDITKMTVRRLFKMVQELQKELGE